MTNVLNATQMFDAWTGNGGAANKAVAWLSVALAESSWDADALSPTGAEGLYQIEPYSWPSLAGPYSNAYNPGFNTLAAIMLSAGGTNFAPWDTAYANIYASGRYSFLAWPEVGSAAWNNFGPVRAALSGIPFTNPGPPPQPGIDGSLPGAIAWYQQVAFQSVPALSNRLRAITARVSGQYRGR